jgi:hypothetical protein
MDENGVRLIFREMAEDELPPVRVNVGLARLRGRRRLRLRRIYARGLVPVAAAAAVALIAGLTQAFSGQQTAATQAGNGLGVAPRAFSLAQPYVTWGWLPSVMTMDGERNVQSTQGEIITAVGKGDRMYINLQLQVTAARVCKVVRSTPPVVSPTSALGARANRDLIAAWIREHPDWRHPRPALFLECRHTGDVVQLTGKAPAVDGGAAYWAADGNLVWEYARYGWAWLEENSLSSDHSKLSANAQLRKIAATLRRNSERFRYGFAWRGAPADWSATAPPGGVYFTVIDGRPAPLALDFGPASDAGAPLQIGAIPPADRPAQFACSVWIADADARSITLDGTKATLVTVNNRKSGQHYQALCDPHIDGVGLQIVLYRNGMGDDVPVPGVASLGGVLGVFHHLRLLGPDAQNWTTNPLR